MDFFERKRLERLPVPAESNVPAKAETSPVSKYAGRVPAALDAIPASVRAEARERHRF